MFRADFLPFTSKIVEHLRYLPTSSKCRFVFSYQRRVRRSSASKTASGKKRFRVTSSMLLRGTT